METGVTKRLAVTGVDFGSVPLACIFRIFESVVGDRVVRILLYVTDEGKDYSVVEFQNPSSAKEAYDFCDGTEIELTGNIFSLSFVPEDIELDSLVGECESSKDFVYDGNMNRKMAINEDMIQLSDDNVLDIEIPEEYKTKPQEEDPQDSEKSDAGKEDDGAANIKEALGEKEQSNECEGFVFNTQDERFADLFEDDDFTLDASNKRFKLQKISRDILDEKRKHSGQS